MDSLHIIPSAIDSQVGLIVSSHRREMAKVWWIIGVLVFTEITSCQLSQSVDHLPLSLKKLQTLMDATLNQEYMDSFRAVMRASRAPLDGADGAVGQLQSGKHLDLFNDESSHIPRHAAHQRSASSRRRARSQALRRGKLNSQSLRNHQLHARRAASPRLAD